MCLFKEFMDIIPHAFQNWFLQLTLVKSFQLGMNMEFIRVIKFIRMKICNLVFWINILRLKNLKYKFLEAVK
jgi:hypothetical protein